MKKALLLALAMLLVGTVANAGYPYVGLYGGVYDADYVEGPGGYDHTMCQVTVPVAFNDIEMWIWWAPDPTFGKGLASVEFKIVYPSAANIIAGAVTANPLILAELGSLPAGIASTVGSLQCQYDWFWSHHQTITVRKTTAAGMLTIVADPGLAVPPFDVLVSDCNFFNYACTKLNDGLGLNQTCAIAVEDKSWGAIKSLYDE